MQLELEDSVSGVKAYFVCHPCGYDQEVDTGTDVYDLIELANFHLCSETHAQVVERTRVE